MRFDFHTPQGKSYFYHDNNNDTIRNPGGVNQTDDINLVTLSDDDFEGVFDGFLIIRGVVKIGEERRTISRVGLRDQTTTEGRLRPESFISYVYLDDEDQERRFKDTARIRDHFVVEWEVDRSLQNKKKDEVLIHFDELYRAIGGFKSSMWTNLYRQSLRN